MSNKQNDIFNEHQAEMKTEVKHTPTPWRVEEGLSHIAVMAGEIEVLFYRSPAKINRENAAFIVTAVNSHEALLDALKTWQKFWDTMPKGQMGKLSFDVGLFNDGFIKMGKAIAQAEVRS